MVRRWEQSCAMPLATVFATLTLGSMGSVESKLLKGWRRGPGSNRRIKVLQTSPLPLGYRALAGLPHCMHIAPNHRSQPGGRRRAEWSGRRDLNSRPSPWQGDALPLSYSRLSQIRVYRAAKVGSNRQSCVARRFCFLDSTHVTALGCALRRLTLPANSRRLRDCEGCGLMASCPASTSRDYP